MTEECVFARITIQNTPVKLGALIIHPAPDKAELLNVQLLLSGYRRHVRVSFHVNVNVYFRR